MFICIWTVLVNEMCFLFVVFQTFFFNVFFGTNIKQWLLYFMSNSYSLIQLEKKIQLLFIKQIPLVRLGAIHISVCGWRTDPEQQSTQIYAGIDPSLRNPPQMTEERISRNEHLCFVANEDCLWFLSFLIHFCLPFSLVLSLCLHISLCSPLLLACHPRSHRVVPEVWVCSRSLAFEDGRACVWGCAVQSRMFQSVKRLGHNGWPRIEEIHRNSTHS